MSHSTREWMRRSKGATAMRIGLFFGAFLLAEAAQATTIVRMSLGEMSQVAKAIARVRCVSNATVWDSGEVWTLTTFEVEQTWRGTLPAEITVRLLGGHTASVTSSVSGVPRFRPNEEAILFLESAAAKKLSHRTRLISEWSMRAGANWRQTASPQCQWQHF